MPEYRFTFVLFMAVILISCKNNNSKSEIHLSNSVTVGYPKFSEPLPVDYKKNTYKISLRENYKISDSLIDWRWAALEDNDDRIDSTGQDAFISLDEPLLAYNNGQWLPSLHIKTEKNKIISFTCSILFDLEDGLNASDNFLKFVSKDFEKLRLDNVRKSIVATGVYQYSNEYYTETYQLIQAKDNENDKFFYTIQLSRHPEFEDFETDIFQGVPVAFDSNSAEVKKHPWAFGSLTSADKLAFAGHFAVVQWQHAANVAGGLAVDLKTGNVYELPKTTLGYQYKKNSRLLVANPNGSKEFCYTCEPRYWLWDEHRNRFVWLD